MELLRLDLAGPIVGAGMRGTSAHLRWSMVGLAAARDVRDRDGLGLYYSSIHRDGDNNITFVAKISDLGNLP